MSRLLLALGLLLTGVPVGLTAATAGAATPPPVIRHVLPNGLAVLVRSDASVGVVAASLQVRAGSLFETADTAGITNFLHRVMIRGTRQHTAVLLTEAIEDLGGSLDASGDVEYGEVRGTALARSWEPLLRLMAEVALRPTLPPDEIERERRLIQSALQTRGDMPFQRALDSVLRDLRASYEPYVNALSTHLRMPLPSWLPPEGGADNWEVTAWESRSGRRARGDLDPPAPGGSSRP